MSALKQQINDDMKSAMRAKEKERLATIRLILSALKQREVDERIELTDLIVLEILDKMIKQRRDSITQYEAAGRPELAAIESAEIDVIQTYMPSPLSDAELEQLIIAAVAESGAQSMREMGAVMSILKPKIQGRADMGVVSQKVKQHLN